MENKSAFSKNQFINSGFDSSEYHYAESEGTYKGILDCKIWGKSKNLLAFICLENGRKIICSAWQKTNYMGFPDIPVDSKITVGFQRAKNGKVYLRTVELLEE